MADYTDDQLVKLLLGDDSDPVHIDQAKRKIVAWKSSITPAAAPVQTPATQTPTTKETVGKPNWLGSWSGNVGDSVKSIIASSGSNTSLFVMYNIPHRDNGNYSAGGLQTAQQYHDWTVQIANAIGGSKAIVIVEPDALGLSPGLANDDQRKERYAMLNDAVAVLKKNTNTKVYVDVSIWSGADNAATLLLKISGMDGFSCNVSGYVSTSNCLDFANAVTARTGYHYVVDTSRNGNGEPHPGKWCNQTDTRVGQVNTLQPNAWCDYYLWIKVPGESDGLGINDDGSHPRNDVPSAGTMWPEFRDAIYSGDWTSFKQKYHV